MPLQGRSWSGFKAPYLEDEGRRGKPHRGGDLPSQDRKTKQKLFHGGTAWEMPGWEAGWGVFGN